MNTTTLLALLHRDLLVARRELGTFLMRVAMQPLLFTFIFGFIMPKQGLVAQNYTNTLLPGILALSMMLSGLQAVALQIAIEFGFTKEIEDRLLAPIGTNGVALEKIFVGMVQAIIAGLFVLPLAWLLMGRGVDLLQTNLPVLLVVSLLTSWLFASLGLLIGTIAESQQVGLMLNLLLGPMLFFGCTYYPWSSLTVVPWFQMAILINPLVYASEGFRAAITPASPHMPLWLILAALTGFCVLVTWLGLRFFKRRAVD
ncbi:MAG TPA: ABC transporter permease [Pyrinomonadaceae bacterium]|nr:ABC transporter permease [Pyrinomonadaceae bacterium]